MVDNYPFHTYIKWTQTCISFVTKLVLELKSNWIKWIWWFFTFWINLIASYEFWTHPISNNLTPTCSLGPIEWIELNEFWTNSNFHPWLVHPIFDLKQLNIDPSLSNYYMQPNSKIALVSIELTTNNAYKWDPLTISKIAI